MSIGLDVQELNNIIVTDDAATTGRWDRLGRDDLPVIVCVIVGVARDLLTLATHTTIVVTERVALDVGVKEDLGVLVAHGDGVVVADFYERKVRKCLVRTDNTYLGSSTGARCPRGSPGMPDS